MTKTCGMPLALPPHAALFTFEKLTGMPSTSSPSDRSSRFRLHKRFTPLVFAFYMAAIMALLMCAVIVAAKDGLNSHYVQHVLQAYVLAMPAAFCCVLLVRPLVMRLVALTVRH